MSTSILYHTWGLKNYRYLRTEYRDGITWFHIEKKPDKIVCPQCLSRDVVLCGQRERAWKAVPVGLHRIRLVAHLHRVDCGRCGTIQLEPLEVAAPKKRYTLHLARYALLLCRKCTIADVADITDLSWDTVKEILKSDLEKRSQVVPLSKLRNLAIDEISYAKGHRYLTVVLDLDSGHVVHVAEGNHKEALQPFFKRLRKGRAKLKAIAMDMHGPYRAAVEEYYRRPVAIVYDRFHVMKLLNEELDEVRRQEQNKIEDARQKKLIKGKRYLLLRNGDNLLPDAKSRLEELLGMNANLSRAYILKEQLRVLYDAPNREEADRGLREWIMQAMASGVKRIQHFARTLVTHYEGVLAYFTHRITTGPLEGTNNLIKVLKRRAYGYRDIAFFKLRILFIHECSMRLAGA